MLKALPVKAVAKIASCVPNFRGKSRAFRRVCGLISSDSTAVLERRFAGGFDLLLDARSRTEGGPLFSGTLDDDDLAFMKACLSPGRSVLDIGANVGLITIPLAAYGRCEGLGVTTLAFEPVASNAARLRRNIQINAMNDTVQVIQAALGEINGTIRISRENALGSSTGNAILGEHHDGLLGSSVEVTEAAIRRLDDVLAETTIAPVGFIKIDVEGAEVGVLRGATNTIAKDRPFIFGEFNNDLMPTFHTTFADVGNVVEPLNYRAFAFTARLQLVPIDFVAGVGNAVLCPVEKIDDLRQRLLRIDANATLTA